MILWNPRDPFMCMGLFYRILAEFYAIETEGFTMVSGMTFFLFLTMLLGLFGEDDVRKQYAFSYIIDIGVPGPKFLF